MKLSNILIIILISISQLSAEDFTKVKIETQKKNKKQEEFKVLGIQRIVFGIVEGIDRSVLSGLWTILNAVGIDQGGS